MVCMVLFVREIQKALFRSWTQPYNQLNACVQTLNEYPVCVQAHSESACVRDCFAPVYEMTPLRFLIVGCMYLTRVYAS